MAVGLQGMGKAKEALKDAEQCIMYNGAWDKGFTRKGAALRESGDRTITSYNSYTHASTSMGAGLWWPKTRSIGGSSSLVSSGTSHR